MDSQECVHEDDLLMDGELWVCECVCMCTSLVDMRNLWHEACVTCGMQNKGYVTERAHSTEALTSVRSR